MQPNFHFKLIFNLKFHSCKIIKVVYIIKSSNFKFYVAFHAKVFHTSSKKWKFKILKIQPHFQRNILDLLQIIILNR